MRTNEVLVTDLGRSESPIYISSFKNLNATISKYSQQQVFKTTEMSALLPLTLFVYKISNFYYNVIM